MIGQTACKPGQGSGLRYAGALFELPNSGYGLSGRTALIPTGVNGIFGAKPK